MSYVVYYYLNLDKIFEYITFTKDKKEKEQEIIDSFESDKIDGTFKLSSKIIKETTIPIQSNYDSIKYDLVKSLIDQILSYNDDMKSITEIDDLPIGTRIAFNSLIELGFLEKIN